MRAVSLCLALVLVATIVPVPAAASQVCEEASCWTLPLYVLAGSTSGVRLLSSLEGDSMPSDVGTRSFALTASTRTLDGITIVKDDAFHVTLTSPTASPSYVNGSIRIVAIDLAGTEFVLAERAFAPPGSDENDTANVTLGAVLDAAPPLRPFANGLTDAVEGRYNEVAEAVGENGDGLASGVLESRYQPLCGNTAWNSPVCGLLTGRPGMGTQIRPCGTSPNPNPSFELVRAIVLTADQAQSPASGRSVCASTFDDLNATAATVDETSGLGGSPIPEYPGPAPEDFGSLPPPPEWKDVTLDASGPSWLPQTDETLTLPIGMRLGLRVALSSAARMPDGQWLKYSMEFESGHPDAETALRVRTTSPGAFAATAYDAEPILAGRHTGFFANTTDGDDYTFTVPAGARIRLENVGSVPLTFHLYDENGVGTHAAGGTRDGGPGAWTLRVARTGVPASANEYAFTLSFVTPQPPDEGGQVAPGIQQGTLEGSDTIDTFYLYVWQAQRFTARISHAESLGVKLAQVPDESTPTSNTWDVVETQGATFHEISARASVSAWQALRISRTYGEGPYTLTLSVDPDGDLSQAPTLYPQWDPPADSLFNEMIPDNGSVLIGVSPLTGKGFPRIDRLTATTSETYLDNLTSPRALDGDGDLILVADVGGKSRLSHGAAGGPVTPIAYSSSPFAFLPDGSYVSSFNVTHFARTTADGARTFVPGSADKLVAAPNGTLYASSPTSRGPTYRFDFDAGALVEAGPMLEGALAFDTEGRAYRLLNRTLVERVDPTSGAARIVAQAPSTHRIHGLELTGTSLAAAVHGHNSSFDQISFVDLDALAFEGFTPSFTPLAVADIRPTSFEFVELGPGVGAEGAGIDRLLRASVSNVGSGAGDAHLVQITVTCFACADPSVGWNATVPALAPGETFTVEVLWRSIGPGEFHVGVDADLYDAVVETDERNNRADHSIAPYTGPLRSTCHEHFDGVQNPLYAWFGQFREFSVLCDYQD